MRIFRIKGLATRTSKPKGYNASLAMVVSEIIGPVKSPYVSAIPLNDKVKRVIGKKVYIK